MTLTALELVVLTLAAYRFTRLVSLDTVTEPLRDELATWERVPRWVGELVGCGFCAGVWVSGLVYAVWVSAVDGWHATGLLEHGVQATAVMGGCAGLIAMDTFLMREAPP